MAFFGRKNSYKKALSIYIETVFIIFNHYARAARIIFLSIKKNINLFISILKGTKLLKIDFLFIMNFE